MDNYTFQFDQLERVMKARQISEAMLCHLSGIDPLRLHYIIRGHLIPNANQLFALAKALNTSTDYFFTAGSEAAPFSMN